MSNATAGWPINKQVMVCFVVTSDWLRKSHDHIYSLESFKISLTINISFLFCRFDPGIEGGESLFLDSFHVAEEFRKQFPEDFDNLVRIPGTFQKVHFQRSV